MEPIGAFLDEEWDSLSKMFSSEDADHFMLQLHGDAMFADDCDGSLFFATPSIFWPVNEGNENVAGVDGAFPYSDTLDYTNFQNISQESSNSSASEGFFSNPSHEFYQTNDINLLQVTNDTPESMDFFVMDDKNNNLVPVFPNGLIEGITCPREEMRNDKFEIAKSKPANISCSGNEVLLKRKWETSELETEAEHKSNDSSENPKQKSRVPRNKTKRNVQSKTKKNQKATQTNNDEEEANVVQNGQSSSCYNSEDDSNASQESNGGETSDNKGPALNLNGKTRASRGSATDPQSLYARKRRERINERLRILQNLIPNGTKVDISTMLEEAVQYVKFMQLQIKVLSSDDLWMYAPIVYNGLDTGLYGKIFPTL